VYMYSPPPLQNNNSPNKDHRPTPNSVKSLQNLKDYASIGKVYILQELI